jgi:site-specific DNA-methyltransferase (adenine-specific)
MIKLSTIKSNPNNPRVCKDDKFAKLVNSIKEFPKMMELRPMVVNCDMVVLGGNMRLKALKEAGYKEVPDEWVKSAESLTEEEQRRFIIADNVGFGEHDWDMLANEWDAVELEAWGLDIPSFETEEVLEAEEDDFDATPPEEPITVLGDLYEIGEHRLLCGDSTDSDQVAKLMDGEKYDLIVTDPPYNVAYEGKTKDALTIKNDKMKSSDFVQFLTDYFSTSLINTKKGGGIYVFFADMELRSFVDAFLDGGFKLSQQLIWLKQTMVMGRKDYHCKHEPILYGWYEGEAHNWYSDRKQTTILEFDRPQRNGEHPTMKPIKLIEYLINNSSKQGDLLGDGFLGSGSTMVASHQLKRKCYGMELDPRYADVIVRRMIKLDPSLTIKRNGVVTKDFE